MRLLALSAALAAVGCQGDTAGPRSVHPVAFSFAPAFATRAADVVPFDRVRVTLSRSSGIALDTTVAFPADADSLVLHLYTPINGASETLTLDLAMINAAGDTVFRGGPLPVTLTTEAGAGAGGPGVTIPVRYSGVGANARNVRIATRSASVFFRDTVALTATALDSSGAPIPGTPIAWRSLDTALARIPSDTSGRVVGGVARGVARIEASLPTGQADTALVTVQPVAAAVAVLSGGGQSAAVGTALPQPVVFRVTAADSAGVQGLAVDVAVASGGGKVGATTDTTDGNGEISVAWTLGALLGAQSITATVAASPSLTATASATGIVGPPKKLAFQVQPSGVAANVAIAPAVTVLAQDSLGNTATAFTGTVTLALGANPGSATLGGTVSVQAVAGVATFGTLSLNLPGTGYTLVASATGLASATSTLFDVSGGVPARLAFGQQPAGGSAGTPIAPAVTVRVEDTNGNLVPSATTAVTIALGANPGHGTLGGTTTANAVAGVATFAGLIIDSAGTGYTLTAGATGLTGATSAGFTIAAGAAKQLAFTTAPPASLAAGAAFGVVVTARDSLGNTATGFNGNMTVAITGGTGTAGAALRGTATVAAVAGVATFTGLSVDSVGAGYTLTATAVGPSAATSAAFAVVSAPAIRLAFTTQPAATTAGTGFGVVVTAFDSLGNVAKGFAGAVAVALTSGTGTAGAALRGTTSATAAAGVATFSGLSVDSAGSGFRLTATASGLPADTSAAFGVAPAPASRLAFTLQPPAGATAGATFSVVVAARDSLGNVAVAFGGTVSLAITAGTGTPGAALRGTTAVTAASGLATFGGLSVDSAGTAYTLTATAGGLANGVSAAFDVGAAPATQLVFTTEPASTTAGTGFGVVVTARDALGNTATGFGGNVTLAITGGTGKAGASLRGTTTVAASAGVASFTGLSVDSVGTGYTLTATAAGAGNAASTTFDVAPAPPSRLVFTTQPANTTGGTAFGVVVTARDSLGNTATTFAGTVTVAITTGTGKTGATLRGTASVSAAAGVATFSGLSVDSAGTGYTLTASSAGLAAGVSATFDVSVGAAVALAFTTQPPSSTTSQAPFAVAVAARDAGGNVVTAYAGAVTVAIGTNPASGTLSGTLSVNAVAGVATFGGLSIDNVGAGYTLTSGAAGLAGATSTAFNVTAAAHVNAWINTAGGNWSVASNWSMGAVPTALDTVTITQSGTYTVNVDVNAAFARLDAGAPSGTQTLAIAANTLTAGNGAFGANTVLSLSGSGSIAGSGTLAVAGAFDWTGGSLGGGGTIRVLAGGTLSIAPTAALSFQAYTLELAGAGTWTGTATVNSGSGAVLRVASGGTLDIQGDPTFAFSLGGATPALDVLGTLTRTSSANPAVLGVAVNDSGTVSVQSGTLRLSGGGTSSGAYAATTGATLDFSGGTHSLSATSSINGAGTVSFSGGTTNAGGAYAVTGATVVAGGVANLNGGSNSTAALTVTSGALGGSGLLTVSGAMSWTGGNLSGAGGTTQVLSSGTLALAPAAAVSLQGYTLELDGTGTWTGTSTVNSGSGAVLRVASGATLDIQGDPNFAFSLGGATSLFDDQGTVNRTTSLNAAVVNAPFTLAGALNLQSGLLTLVQGGTLSGTATLAGTTVLELAGGTFSLANNFRATGGGLSVTLGGTLGGLAATDTAFFDNLQLGGGTVSLSGGTIKTPVLLTWNQTTSVSGGTLYIPAGAALNLGIIGAASLSSATILNAGSAAFTTSGTLNSGSGAVIRNLPGASFAFSAPGSYLFSLGGATSLFDNQGTLSVAPSSGAAVVSAAFSNSGTLQVLLDTLRLEGGASGTFPGTVSVASGAVLDLGGGTFTLGSALPVGGALRVSGGALVPNGHSVAVTGNFATAGSGALQMTLATDSLDVGGTATFGGGAGTLSAGALTLRGDFVQTTNATAFAATGTQHVYFSGAGTQNISFANPTTSFFRRLEIPAILHNVVLQTNVQVTDSLNMLAGGSAATMLGAGTGQRLTVGGLLTLQQSTSSPKLTPPVLELSVAPAVSTTPGTLSPDTTVYLGGIATLPTGAGISYKSIRVGTTGAMTVPGNVTIPGDLVVSSGTFSIPDKTTFSAGGKLRTSGSGVLATPGGASVMVTGDSAIFGGGSESGQLTAGQLQVGGNFVQLGSGSQFAATGSQRTVLDRAAAGVQTIQFADSLNSFFHDLVLSRTTVDTVRLMSNVQVQDSAIVSAASVLASTAQEALKLPLAGILRVHSQAVLKPFRVEAGTWVLDSTFLGGNAVRISPDTAVLLNAGAFDMSSGSPGFISSSPAPVLGWKSVRLESGTLTSTGTSYGGDLVVEGTARYALSTAGVTDSIAGKLRTLGTAAIEMNVGTAPPTIAVGDSALFGGGSELDLLASGILRLYGSFVQSGNTQSFYATTGHTTVFAGSGKQTVTFANPGTSTFGNLAIERSVGGVSQSAGITLGSTVTVSGLLEDSTFAGGVTDSIFGNGNGLIAAGLSLGSQFVMNDAPLATTGSALVFSGLTFRNMSPTVTQWTIELPSGAQAAVSGLTFQTAPTTGLYFDARVLTSGTATLLVSGASPPTLSAGQYNRTANGTVTVSWNGSSLP